MIEAPNKPLTLEERLASLYHDWSGDQPAEIISSLAPDPLNKYRKGWFTSVLGNLQIGSMRGLWPEQIQTQVLDLTQRFCTPAFHDQTRVTGDDIQRVDRVLAVIVGSKGGP